MRHDAGRRIDDARSFLFVPANRPERIAKALATEADIVIVDLEDAVPPDERVAARAALTAQLDPDRPVLLRVNDAGTGWFDEDLRVAAHPGVLGIMLAKAEPGDGLARACAVAPVVALIESAHGVADVRTIAATPGVRRLAFGTIDLALDLGVTDETLLATLGLQLVLASRVGGIAAPIDGVTTDFRDPDVVARAMTASAKAGFGAKMCIHPAQVAAIHAALRPTEGAVAYAHRVIAAAEQANGAAIAVDGRMIDKPVIAQAQRILANID